MRASREYLREGKRVGIVTNDQSTDLVDTHHLRSQGFDVGEVTGSCFCCNFDALTNTLEMLGERERPDVILAEPVGSCTDLVATVMRPLTHVYRRPLDIAPYGVILKPSHGMKILRREPQGGFALQAEYIFRKQLEEADFVLINRIDQLSEADVTELKRLLVVELPGRPSCQSRHARARALPGCGSCWGNRVDGDSANWSSTTTFTRMEKLHSAGSIALWSSKPRRDFNSTQSCSISCDACR